MRILEVNSCMARRLKHFGCIVIEGKYGLEINRESYALINSKCSLPMFPELMKENAYADETGTTYTDEWCKYYQLVVLQNYDLNMQYFSTLNHEEFQIAISDFCNKNRNFKEVKDLTEYAGQSGYYVMVLDKYCQVYIGTAVDIKRRIQHHWSNRKNFDRLLFPMYAVNESILSIDSFRALDTTRIFACKTKRTYVFENKYIDEFPSQFVINRLGGGRLSQGPLGYLEALGMMKSRELE